MKEAPATCQILSQLRPSREQEGKGSALLEEFQKGKADSKKDANWGKHYKGNFF
jgi:hypothetical protein